MRNPSGFSAVAGLAALAGLFAGPASAAPIVFSASGANAASIQATVDSFRAALGVNNGLGPCTGACVPGVGRREINWDGVPDSFSSGGANPFPGDFFNQSSPAGRARGAEFTTTGAFEVSADSDADGDGNPGPVATLFGNHSPDNANDFAAFSAERIFGLVGTNQMDVLFSVPGSPDTSATVRGFGAVFTDVEVQGSTRLELFDVNGFLLHAADVPPFVPVSGAEESFKSFSFLGVTFDTPSVFRVHITNGGFDLDLVQFGVDDAAAMDDFIYGEPTAVPEPGSLVLLATGCALVLRRRSSRRHGPRD